MRIVCDTNILLRAALNPNGPASELLKHIRANCLLVASRPLLTELLDVLRRPKIQALHGLNERGIRRFVSSIYKVATIVQVPEPVPRIVPHDPDDDAIMLTAVGGKADVLTTRDQHLFHPDVVAIATQHGLRILTDETLLKELQDTG
jgi:putative PIN family toxin of toxin-antitoxin system